MPKVSIVLPTYNGEKYIKESIESILSQTLTDWELIIVNDCSKDTTASIISEYASEDDRIKIITNEQNQKLPESLNIGFRQACGEYLTWTSDDNMYKPQALKTMADYLDSNQECPMVCTAMDVIDADGVYLYTMTDYSDEKMLYTNCVGACFMYRYEVMKKIGDYDNDKFLVEDYNYWLRIFFNYGKIDFIDKNIYKYRIHEQSLTKQRKLQISMQLMKMRKQYLDNIINMCNNEKYILCSIYCDFMLEECLDNVSRNKLIKAVPEVNAICEGVPSEQIVIYGAGNIGKKAYALYKDSVLYYADQNPLLYGKKINGVEVILPDKISEIQSKFDIVIALSTDKIYSAIKQLEKYNVKKYLYKDINKQY